MQIHDERLTINVLPEATQTVVVLAGCLNFKTVADIHRTMRMATQAHPTHDVALDCRQLKYIDSSALGAIILWLERLRVNNCKLNLIVQSGPVAEACKLFGLHKMTSMKRD